MNCPKCKSNLYGPVISPAAGEPRWTCIRCGYVAPGNAWADAGYSVGPTKTFKLPAGEMISSEIDLPKPYTVTIRQPTYDEIVKAAAALYCSCDDPKYFTVPSALGPARPLCQRCNKSCSDDAIARATLVDLHAECGGSVRVLCGREQLRDILMKPLDPCGCGAAIKIGTRDVGGG